MAIEFACHSCGGKLATADQYGDRHGRCPFCKKLIRVPAATEETGRIDKLVGEATDEITASILEDAAAEAPAAEFEPDVPDLTPEPTAAPAPAEKPKRPAKKMPAPPPPPKDAKNAISFDCLLCGEEIAVGQDLAGKKIGCPGCGEQLTVPSS